MKTEKNIFKTDDKQNLYKLFRSFEDTMGSTHTTVVALESLIEAIEALDCTEKNIADLIIELIDVIKNTEPRVIPLIHLIQEFEREIQPHLVKSVAEIKTFSKEILNQKIVVLNRQRQKVVENGQKCIQNNDVIIVHSISALVEKILLQAHEELGKKFTVIILKQDFLKTKHLIESLSTSGIGHLIIPEYSLSHYVKPHHKLFLGALSVTQDKKVIAAAGTSGVVSVCHLAKIPVYLFIFSLKFSHRPYAQQFIHVKEEEKSQEDMSFRVMTHSHDVIDLDLIDYVITDKLTNS